MGETDPNTARHKPRRSSASDPFFKIATKKNKNDFFVIFVSFVVHFGPRDAAFSSLATHSAPRNGVKIQNFHVIWWGGEGFVFSISISIAIAIPISMIALIQ
jgi:hypothetical protein